MFRFLLGPVLYLYIRDAGEAVFRLHLVGSACFIN